MNRIIKFIISKLGIHFHFLCLVFREPKKSRQIIKNVCLQMVSDFKQQPSSLPSETRERLIDKKAKEIKNHIANVDDED